MWLTWILIGVVTSTVIIINLWEKFQTNPTITGLDTDFHNWEVPFPALTICQHSPTSEENINEFIFSKHERNTTEDELKFYTKLSELTLTTWADFNEKYLIGNILDKTTDIKEVFIKITNKCENLFNTCYWKSTAYNCCDIFYPVFTENGFCYTFNSKHHEAILSTDLKSTNSKDNSKFIKYFIHETDLNWSLLFEVKSKASFFSIYILNSNEIVSIDTKPQHIWDFRIEAILFSVKETYTTEDTSQLNLKQRRCAFPNDIKIKIDDTYSYSACTTECRMKTLMRLCSCIPFFYPLIDETYRHCKINEMKCISSQIDMIKSVDGCNCHLGCLHTVYEVEKLNTVVSEDEDGTTSLETKFVSWPMVKYKREVLFGWVDLLVSFGGIAGLFLGFSLLSAVEIIYYFTIRLSCIAITNKD